MSARIAKVAAVVLGIAVALLLLAWYLRDTLIREISNPLLDEYGIVVTDVSLDALATNNASIAHLELTYDNDTIIAIDGLTLPIIGDSEGPRTYSAHKVSIEMGDKGGEPVEPGPFIDRVLSLANELAGNEFQVAELSVPPYPSVYDLRWTLADDEQALDARVDSVSLFARIRETGMATHRVDISIPAGRISADLQRDESGYSLNGSSEIELSVWSPLAKLAGVVPREIRIDAGTGQVTLDIDIPFDAGQTPSALVELSPLSPLQLVYAHESGETTSITVQAGSPAQITAVFPEVDWTLRQANLSLQVSYGDWTDVPLALGNILCNPGPVCSMSARVDMENGILPVGNVGETSMNALINVVFADDAVEVELQPGAVMDIRRLEMPGIEAGRIEGRLISTGLMEVVDAGWTLAAASIDGNVEGLRMTEDVTVAAPVFLEDVTMNESEGVLTARTGIYVPKILAKWNMRDIDIVGAKGAVNLRGNSLQAEFATVGLQQDGSLQLQHDLQTGAGKLRLADAVASFGAKALSDRVSPWRDQFDLRSGTVALNVAADWQDSGQTVQGKASAVVSNLTGFYEETVFADLSTALEIGYGPDDELTVAPAALTIGLVEVGMPITDISADFALDPDTSSVAVEHLNMTALGGTVHADPFSFRTDTERNTLTLHAESIDMDDLLTVREFEAIEVSGSMRAELPVTIESGMITIADGTLTGEPPGGVIRYLPDTPPDESDASSVAFVRRVLSNFRYEALSSVVNYTERGDLKLQLRLEGRNPDMDETRPVVLNLDVENNVPQMLRSLRAARAVEEVLEQRFLRQREDGK